MAWFKRIALFLVTNLLVMATLSIAWSIISSFLGIRGSGNIGGLLALCSFWGMSGALISLMMSKFMAKTFMGVKVIDPNTPNPSQQQLLKTVYRLAERAGLNKMPEVGVYESPDVNAFATGPSRNNSLVAVSTGLLQVMSEDEVEGVLGHEVAHIANGDMVTMTLIQGIINSFAMFFSRIIARVLASQVEEKNAYLVYAISSFVLDLVFTILGSIAVNYFSRLREFRADAGGAKFAGREKMIAGLRRLQTRYESMEKFQDDGNMSAGVATLKISHKSTGVMALFATHPPLAERISRLEAAR